MDNDPNQNQNSWRSPQKHNDPNLRNRCDRNRRGGSSTNDNSLLAQVYPGHQQRGHNGSNGTSGNANTGIDASAAEQELLRHIQDPRRTRFGGAGQQQPDQPQGRQTTLVQILDEAIHLIGISSRLPAEVPQEQQQRQQQRQQQNTETEAGAETDDAATTTTNGTRRARGGQANARASRRRRYEAGHNSERTDSNKQQ